MEELYEELLVREKMLEERRDTLINDGRLAEVRLIIVRVQQILLENLNK